MTPPGFKFIQPVNHCFSYSGISRLMVGEDYHPCRYSKTSIGARKSTLQPMVFLQHTHSSMPKPTLHHPLPLIRLDWIGLCKVLVHPSRHVHNMTINQSAVTHAPADAGRGKHLDRNLQKVANPPGPSGSIDQLIDAPNGSNRSAVKQATQQVREAGLCKESKPSCLG